MKQYKWLSKKLISGTLVIVMLAVTASVGLGTSLLVAASNPPPEIEWEKTFGGSSYDFAYSVEQTTDGGYILSIRSVVTLDISVNISLKKSNIHTYH